MTPQPTVQPLVDLQIYHVVKADSRVAVPDPSRARYVLGDRARKSRQLPADLERARCLLSLNL
jgi:hypothetical protein